MSDKKVYIFGGPNGVGKSTLGEQHSNDSNITFVNPDFIKQQQELRYSQPLSPSELFHILDVYICNALEYEDAVLIENNLHDPASFKFLLSYINKYEADSICYFYYLDNVDTLIERVQKRVRHLGHSVPVEIIIERYNSSFDKILENINVFDEIHFYDTSTVPARLIFEIVEGKLNYISEELAFDFEWSKKMISILMAKED